MERAAGIEPATCPWQGYVLPLAPCPLVLAESVGVEPTQRLITIVGLAIRCLTIRPTLQCCYYILKLDTGQVYSWLAQLGHSIFKLFGALLSGLPSRRYITNFNGFPM